MLLYLAEGGEGLAIDQRELLTHAQFSKHNITMSLLTLTID